MVTYDENGQPLQKEEATKEGYEDFVARMKANKSPATPQPIKKSFAENAYERIKNLMTKPILKKPQREKQSRFNIPSHFKNEKQFQQNLRNMLFDNQARGTQTDYNRKMRLLRAKMKYLKMQQQGQIPIRRIRNYKNMPPQLRQYYENQARQMQQQNQTPLSRKAFQRQGSRPAPSLHGQYYQEANGTYRPAPTQRQKTNISFFNSNRRQTEIVQTQPEKFMAYRVPRRKGKLGCRYSEEKENW